MCTFRRTTLCRVCLLEQAAPASSSEASKSCGKLSTERRQPSIRLSREHEAFPFSSEDGKRLTRATEAKSREDRILRAGMPGFRAIPLSSRKYLLWPKSQNLESKRPTTPFPGHGQPVKTKQSSDDIQRGAKFSFVQERALRLRSSQSSFLWPPLASIPVRLIFTQTCTESMWTCSAAQSRTIPARRRRLTFLSTLWFEVSSCELAYAHVLYL